jgi:hypothetical protein
MSRPYQVMIVVEESIYSGETLPGNPGDILSNPQLLETLHTPFVAELANQVIFVPEAFFDKERKALDRGEKMWDEVVNKYAVSAPIGPGDPIVPVIDEVRDMVSRSPSTSTLAAGLEARMDFARRTRPDLLDEVMRQADADASARSAP